MLIVNKKDDKILLIDKVVINTTKNSKTLKVTGTCIKGITKRRIIATNGYDRVAEDYAENIQKQSYGNGSRKHTETLFEKTYGRKLL